MGKALAIQDIQTSWIDDKNILILIDTVRKGIKFSMFTTLSQNSPFSLQEWSHYLHLSERTMQRYKTEKKTFDPIHSEKILEITLLYQRGVEVFGNSEKFDAWLDTKNISLGGAKPKDLLDNTFGINMLKDALTRIEYGVLA